MTNESLTPVSYQWESVMSEYGDFIIEVEPLAGIIGMRLMREEIFRMIKHYEYSIT